MNEVKRGSSYGGGYKFLNIGMLFLLCVVGLTLMGLVVLSSASQSLSESRAIFQKQLIWMGLAVIGGVGAFLVNLEWVYRKSYYFGVVAVVLLVLVMVPGIGVRVNGAQRWMDFGPIRLQVSELGKLGLILGLARYLFDNQRELGTFWRGFGVPCGMIGLVCGLIIVEPDFGTTFLCGMVGMVMLYLSGVRLKYMVPSLLGGVMMFGVAVMLDPVRLKRLTSFLDVEANKSDGAYQLWQGILAFVAGGVDGVGLGNGRQQMHFLPEAHTDFIFPVIGEELGVYFTSGVVMGFLGIFLIGVYVLRYAPNLYYFNMVLGAVMCITLQSLINVGVVTGLLPTKGMSLPFISYGGSNLVFMFVLVGLVLNCMREWTRVPIRRPTHL